MASTRPTPSSKRCGVPPRARGSSDASRWGPCGRRRRNPVDFRSEPQRPSLQAGKHPRGKGEVDGKAEDALQHPGMRTRRERLRRALGRDDLTFAGDSFLRLWRGWRSGFRRSGSAARRRSNGRRRRGLSGRRCAPSGRDHDYGERGYVGDVEPSRRQDAPSEANRLVGLQRNERSVHRPIQVRRRDEHST